jgi:hypothetical protein
MYDTCVKSRAETVDEFTEDAEENIVSKLEKIVKRLSIKNSVVSHENGW